MTLAACEDLVRRGDPDRHATLRAVPEPVRAKLLPLYAFNIEVSRAPWVTAEPLIAEMRLQWWRDALEEIREGRPVRVHEVTTPLARVLDPESAAILDRLVEARRWDIGRAPFADAAAREAYLGDTAGGLMWVAARLLGATEEEPVRRFGTGAGAAAFLQAVPELVARGRRPLDRHDAAEIRALAQKGLGWLDDGARGRRAVPPAAMPAMLAGWRARPVLAATLSDPAAALQAPFAQSEFRRRARLAGLALFGWWR